MIDPRAVPDADGEWFEVYNPSRMMQVDINGWTIGDGSSGGHLIDNGGPLLVPEWGFLVIARNADPLANGGVDRVAYQMDGVAFSNAGDVIELVDGDGTVVDSVEYTASMAYGGAAASLNPMAFDPESNDLRSSWCRASSELTRGDQGTPGAANDPC